jgi:hypothetical protein
LKYLSFTHINTHTHTHTHTLYYHLFTSFSTFALTFIRLESKTLKKHVSL